MLKKKQTEITEGITNCLILNTLYEQPASRNRYSVRNGAQ